MNTPTYKQQFDKLTEAYIMGNVDPWECKACFVGNLLGGDQWEDIRSGAMAKTVQTGTPNKVSSNYKAHLAIDFIKERSNGLYTPEEIISLEATFLHSYGFDRGGSVDENALFISFEKTLNLLKQIHISKGEIIDDAPVFQKRTLTPELNK